MRARARATTSGRWSARAAAAPDILVVNMPGSTKPFTALDVTCVSLGTAAAAERNSAPETLSRARENLNMEK